MRRVDTDNILNYSVSPALIRMMLIITIVPPSPFNVMESTNNDNGTLAQL